MPASLRSSPSSSAPAVSPSQIFPHSEFRSQAGIERPHRGLVTTARPTTAISLRSRKSCSERQNLLGSAAPFRPAFLPAIDGHYVLDPPECRRCARRWLRSEEHTSELQSPDHVV